MHKIFVIPLTQKLQPRKNVRPLVYYWEKELKKGRLVEIEVKIKRRKEFIVRKAVVIKTEPLKKIEVKKQGLLLKRIYKVLNKKISIENQTEYSTHTFPLPSCLNNSVHNFPGAGADCLICGINQYEISGYKGLKRIEYKPKELSKKIHSKEHWLAGELSRYFNEPRSFGMYLGIIKNKGFQNVYTAFSETKQSRVKDKVKLFMWKIKGLAKPSANQH